MVGLGFDRDVLEDAGIKEADAFLAVSSGDNSNILSARVARETYHVPKVIARIYDPMRADIYERLNIPTVSTTRWGVKQMILMLTHPGEEIKETLAAGDLFRMRVEIPSHLVGKPVSSLNMEGKILVPASTGAARGSSPSRRARSRRATTRPSSSRRTRSSSWRSSCNRSEITEMRVVISGAGAVGGTWRRTWPIAVTPSR
jgi:K+ transport systems, NAD-binding component